MVKRSGYIYNKKTSPGFQKMKRQGIVMPPFRIEDDVTRLLTGHYDRLIKKVDQVIRSVKLMEKATTGKTTFKLLNEITTDSLFGEIMGQIQDAILRSIPSDR